MFLVILNSNNEFKVKVHAGALYILFCSLNILSLFPYIHFFIFIIVMITIVTNWPGTLSFVCGGWMQD